MSAVFQTIRPARFTACGAVFLFALCAAFPALAQTAGKFLVAVGEVKLIGKDGKTRAAARGGELLEGDTIVTGADSLAQIRLQDNGLLSVRPNTEMKLDKFSFAGADDRKATLLISLVQGGLRSITGLIGKAHREGYKISTATATIGIRGTDHEPYFIPPGQTALGTPGTYDKVNSGMTFIQGRQGNPIDVSINQVAFVPVTGAQPVILPSVPSFYKQDLPVPDPQSRKTPAGDSSTETAATGKGTDTRTLSVDSNVLDSNVRVKSDTSVKSLSDTSVRALAISPIDTKATTSTVLTTPLTTTVSPAVSTLSTTVVQPVTTTLTTTVTQPVTSTVATPVTTTVTSPVTTLQTTVPSLLDSTLLK
ncbi:MAG: FecR family protein [Burkholderiales bacterium]|nr:FecR family protein [Burkholderiales bacterium]